MTAEQILDRMEQLNAQIRETVSKRGDDLSGQIVSLRHDFTTECGNFLMAMSADARIFGNRDLFSQMQTDLEAMRLLLSGHQLKWQSNAIEADNEAYSRASANTFTMVSDFIANARAQISADQ